MPTASAASVLRSLESPFAAVRGSMAVVRKHIFSNITVLVSTYSVWTAHVVSKVRRRTCKVYLLMGAVRPQNVNIFLMFAVSLHPAIKPTSTPLHDFVSPCHCCGLTAGAMIVFISEASMEGNISFVNNSAEAGGEDSHDR